MEITRITTIELEGAEIDALQTLKSSYTQCVIDACFECLECPLYVNKSCIGQLAETVLESQKEKEKN